jgi:hypothetical protein
LFFAGGTKPQRDLLWPVLSLFAFLCCGSDKNHYLDPSDRVQEIIHVVTPVTNSLVGRLAESFYHLRKVKRLHRWDTWKESKKTDFKDESILLYLFSEKLPTRFNDDNFKIISGSLWMIVVQWSRRDLARWNVDGKKTYDETSWW